MLVTRGETYKLELIKRKENDDYKWEESPSLTFKGRPANQFEKKNYRIQKGVNGNTDSVFIYATNLPKDVQPMDKVIFLGKEMKVQSVGYYFDASLIVNADIMSEEQIIERCPKGLALQ